MTFSVQFDKIDCLQCLIISKSHPVKWQPTFYFKDETMNQLKNLEINFILAQSKLIFFLQGQNLFF